MNLDYLELATDRSVMIILSFDAPQNSRSATTISTVIHQINWNLRSQNIYWVTASVWLVFFMNHMHEPNVHATETPMVGRKKSVLELTFNGLWWCCSWYFCQKTVFNIIFFTFSKRIYLSKYHAFDFAPLGTSASLFRATMNKLSYVRKWECLFEEFPATGA